MPTAADRAFSLFDCSFALLAVACALTGMATAQTTWVVDALNRPGTSFTDLPAAVAAASPGDLVQVRWVDPLIVAYTAPIIDRGITVMGIGGKPGIKGALDIRFLPAGQQLQIRDLLLAPFVGGSQTVDDNCHLLIRSNAGSVHLQDVDRLSIATLSPSLSQFLIDQSDVVTFSHCQLPMPFNGNYRIQRTRFCAAYSMTFSGGSFFGPLVVEHCELSLVDCTVAGNVSLCDATIRLVGATTVQADIGSFFGTCTPASRVFQAPGATVNGAIAANLTLGVEAGLGAFVDNSRTLNVAVLGEAGGFSILAFGPPALPPLPLFGGLLYLDPLQFAELQTIALGANGRGSWTVTVPPTLPAGFSTWLQAGTAGATTDILLTNPAVVTLP